MALDLLSGEGEEIPRRYRHDAESFAWSLIYLYLATVKDSEGNNHTRDPHPLRRWFTDRKSSHDAKVAFGWHDHSIAGIPLAYLNTKALARALHKYWTDRYTRELRHKYDLEEEDHDPSLLAEIFGIEDPTTKHPPYKELDDGRVFKEVLFRHARALYAEPLGEIYDRLVEMYSKYRETGRDT